MKDQTVLFGRLTHKDGYNAAIGLTVFIKQESMKQGQFWNIQEVSCVLYFICWQQLVYSCVTMSTRSLDKWWSSLCVCYWMFYSWVKQAFPWPARIWSLLVTKEWHKVNVLLTVVSQCSWTSKYSGFWPVVITHFNAVVLTFRDQFWWSREVGSPHYSAIVQITLGSDKLAFVLYEMRQSSNHLMYFMLLKHVYILL